MDGPDELPRLRTCINNLVSLVALRDVWGQYDTPQIVRTLLDVLVHMLRLEFAYARLGDIGAESRFEALRVASDRKMIRIAQEVGRELEQCLTEHPRSAGPVPNPAGSGKVWVAQCWLGLDQRAGVVVAGAQRADFPMDTETLVLRVAVNQALIELQRLQVAEAQNHAAEAERLRHDLEAENIHLRQNEVATDERREVDHPSTQSTTLDDMKRDHILRVLKASRWVISGKSGAAAKLGMKRTTLQHVIRRLGITRDD